MGDTVDTKAPRAAGVIHKDFERGFIKAERHRKEFRLGREFHVIEILLSL